MKLLFVHDHPFYQDAKLVYSGGSLPAKIWSNYTASFDKVIVVGRKSNQLKDKTTLSSSDNVSFALIEDYSSVKDLFFNYRKIARFMQQEIDKADVVLARLPSILGFIAARLALQSKKALVIEQVGNAKEAMNTHGSLLGRLSAPILHLINKSIVKKASHVIYVTPYKLQKDYPTKGVSTSISDVMIPEVLKKEEVDTIRFFGDKIKIGLIGGFDVRYKGQDVLLDAISILPNEVRDVIELYFVGKGDSTWIVDYAAEKGLSRNIKFMGAKEGGEEIFKFLEAMSLYVQPSLTEGMPRAMLEAMSRGCPVLASKAGGIPDIIQNDFLHAPKDFREFSKQINCFVQNREVLKQNALDSVVIADDYQRDNLLQKRCDFFNDVKSTIIHD